MPPKEKKAKVKPGAIELPKAHSEGDCLTPAASKTFPIVSSDGSSSSEEEETSEAEASDVEEYSTDWTSTD